MWLNYCNLMIKFKQIRCCFLMDKQRKQCVEMESSPGEDVVKTGEVTTKDLEYYLVDKAWFEKADSNSERSSEGKTAMHVTEKSLEKGRVNRGGKLHCRLTLRYCHNHNF